MYVVFTYRCPDCGHVEDRFVRRSEMDEQWCGLCSIDEGEPEGHLVRLAAGTRTHFRFADTRLKR